MQIFLSYPSEERSTAERIHFALGAAGHEVFFDREDLRPGLEYDRTVRRAMQESALIVFLITPGSVTEGRYTLTELRLAEERWPRPSGRVLPVMLRATPIESVPAYLRAVSILDPSGDVVAEVANEVERLLVAVSLGRRVLRALASPFGLALLAVVLLTGIAGWRFRSVIAERLGISAAGSALPADIRARARTIVAMAEGYAVIAAAPPELLRFDEGDRPIGNALALPGDVTAVRKLPEHLLLATGSPHEILVMALGSGSVIDTLSLDDRPIAGEVGVPVSRTIVSVEFVNGVFWATTGGDGARPALLRMRPGGEWVVATTAMTVPPDSAEFDARGLFLRANGQGLWALTRDEEPTRLYRVWGTIRVDRIAGPSAALIECAHDILPADDGNLLAMSCDGELQELVEDGVTLTRLHSTPVVSDSGWRADAAYPDHIVAEGRNVFVAVHSRGSTPARPLRARIYRVDDRGSTLLFERRDAAIVSMAVTPQAVLAILRRDDGRWDVRRVDRDGGRAAGQQR